MRYADLFKKFGSHAGIAKALGIKHRQTTHKWKAAGIPLEYQLRAEAVTRGELKADISRDVRKAIREAA